MLALSLKCPEGLLFGWVVFCLSAGFTDGTWEGLTGGGGGAPRVVSSCAVGTLWPGSSRQLSVSSGGCNPATPLRRQLRGGCGNVPKERKRVPALRPWEALLEASSVMDRLFLPPSLCPRGHQEGTLPSQQWRERSGMA